MDGTLRQVYGNGLCVQTQDAYTHANTSNTQHTPQHTPQHTHIWMCVQSGNPFFRGVPNMRWAESTSVNQFVQ